MGAFSTAFSTAFDIGTLEPSGRLYTATGTDRTPEADTASAARSYTAPATDRTPNS